MAKRFSPIVTRSRSRFPGQLSDSSHTTDQSHLGTIEDQNDKSAEKGLRHRRRGNKGNATRKKSKGLAEHGTKSTLDIDNDTESTMGSLPPLEELSDAEDTQPLRQTRTGVISKSGNRGFSDLPPLPKRTTRLSRRLNPAGISGTKRSTRLSSLIHKPQEGSITRKSRKVDQEEPSMQISLSNLSSSPVKFQPKGRRSDQFIYYRPDSSQCTTISSVNSSPGVSLSHPPSDTQHPYTSPSRHPAFHSGSQHPAGAVGKEVSRVSLESSQQTTVEEGAGTELESTRLSRMSSGGDEADTRKCVFKQPFVLLRKIDESDRCNNNSNRSESVLPPLLPPLAIPGKPGKGWRRSIAIRARAVSLNLGFICL